ncbi:hypothetical protein AAEX28_13395 [Lentisphaerota bacterium WC36G]|nr:hypothetical protein LJT99_00150 [Lentisphaerae bacterium WC36]
MKMYEFIYEDEFGRFCNYYAKANSLAEAEHKALSECPDAINAQIEYNVFD